MQYAITTISLAPVVTGHPLGIPEPRRPSRTAFDIAPIQRRGDVEAAISDARNPADFWRAVSGQPHADHAAPPSMLQIRISQLLESETTPAPDEVSDAPDDAAAADAPGAELPNPLARRDPTGTDAGRIPFGVSGFSPVRVYPAPSRGDDALLDKST